MVWQNDHVAPSLDLRVFSSKSRTDNESFHWFGGWRLSRRLFGGKPRLWLVKLTWMLVISILSWHDYFSYQTYKLTTHMKYVLEWYKLYFVRCVINNGTMQYVDFCKCMHVKYCK